MSKPVEVFSREQFESALPTHKDTGEILWEYIGFRDGEHCYTVPLPDGNHRISVRSSIGSSGWSAESGQDSIRVWLEELKQVLNKGMLTKAWVGVKKKQRWVTRIEGWDRRMVGVIRELYALGDWKSKMESDSPYCPRCGKPMRVRFRKKDDAPFWGCYAFPSCRGTKNLKTS